MEPCVGPDHEQRNCALERSRSVPAQEENDDGGQHPANHNLSQPRHGNRPDQIGQSCAAYCDITCPSRSAYKCLIRRFAPRRQSNTNMGWRRTVRKIRRKKLRSSDCAVDPGSLGRRSPRFWPPFAGCRSGDITPNSTRTSNIIPHDVNHPSRLLTRAQAFQAHYCQARKPSTSTAGSIPVLPSSRASQTFIGPAPARHQMLQSSARPPESTPPTFYFPPVVEPGPPMPATFRANTPLA